jgi:hypothetical protein
MNSLIDLDAVEALAALGLGPLAEEFLGRLDDAEPPAHALVADEQERVRELTLDYVA